MTEHTPATNHVECPDCGFEFVDSTDQIKSATGIGKRALDQSGSGLVGPVHYKPRDNNEPLPVAGNSGVKMYRLPTPSRWFETALARLEENTQPSE